jgi:hypothetical protein
MELLLEFVAAERDGVKLWRELGHGLLAIVVSSVTEVN